MSFCTKCGLPRSSSGVFCTGCGAPLPAENVAASPAAGSVGAAAPYADLPVPQKQGHGLRNFLIVAFVLLLVVVGLGIAGAIYAARAAKEKATNLINQIVPGTISSTDAPARSGASAPYQPSAPLSSPPGSAAADVNPGAAAFPELPTGAHAASGAVGPAPLKEGMLVVTALADLGGDYESIKSITKIDATGVTLRYSSEHSKPAGGDDSKAPAQEVNVNRKVLTEDLNTAHDYSEVFGSNDPESYPGTTAISASKEVYAQLKQQGATSFSYRPDGLKGAIGSLVSMFGGLAGGNAKGPNGASLEQFQKEPCALKRQGNGLFAFPVLLDNQPTTVPALRASCATDDGPADFYILDQPDYPLMLQWKLGSGSTLQVIKISYPPPPKTKQAAPSAMEQQLKEKKKVEIYGIYFDFASDRLKPESTPVLQEIAGVLKDNPEWKLTVSGHTDSVGGDASNLDLSKRRAAAVKQALVTQYHVAADRLTTDGFGASRPVDTNDTLAGRARNRRVELTRE